MSTRTKVDGRFVFGVAKEFPIVEELLERFDTLPHHWATTAKAHNAPTIVIFVPTAPKDGDWNSDPFGFNEDYTDSSCPPFFRTICFAIKNLTRFG